ncbi:MAG: methylenetetrahydrofolate reductase [Nitrospirae bacterium]|nr:methylenetetrahydrofolate reductase [Candidatus Manganitrophaceae bacterium]
MNISFEVVPRDVDSLKSQLHFVETHLPFVETINVPDLLRLPVRSWEAGKHIAREKYRFIPHLRAIDFDLKETRLERMIEECELDTVLLVSGDPPPNRSHPIYDTHVLEMIAKVRASFPAIKIFAAVDPYRSSLKREKAYMLKKLDVGADYLMSQPFFDMRLLEIFSELIPSEKAYWGISPIVKDQSRAYWEKMNQVVFPSDFKATYDWNIAFAEKVLSFCRLKGGNVYFMPINIDLEKYFSPIAHFLEKSSFSE